MKPNAFGLSKIQDPYISFTPNNPNNTIQWNIYKIVSKVNFVEVYNYAQITQEKFVSKVNFVIKATFKI